MSETPISQPGFDESPGRRPVEILHYPNSDIVINRSAERVGWAPRLAELFKDDLPDWQPIDNSPNDSSHGVVDGVDFLLKPKMRSGVEGYDQQKEVRMRLARTNDERRSVLRTTQMLNSVLSEIALSPQIKGLVAAEEAQGLAKGWGFKSFSLAEPVIGVTYKPSGQKFLVYEYIDGAEPLSDESVKAKYQISFEKQEEMSSSLHGYFQAHNIYSNDLSARQLIVDPQGNLYLTDIEIYRKILPKNEVH